MNKSRIVAAAISAIMMFPLMSGAQIKPAPVESRHAVEGHSYLKEYWGRPEIYLQHQAYYMLNMADQVLNDNPPATTVNREREMAFLMVDAVTHEADAMHNPAVLDFLAARMNHVIADLDKPLKGRKTVRIYKLYNCGTLLRTRDMIVAIDINGRNGALIPNEIMERIVKKVDVLFLTHNHGDHTDINVRDLCHKYGIPIYATDEIFKEDKDVNHVWFEGNGSFEASTLKGKIPVIAIPGHQDALQNNIWVITMPNGKVVCTMGDQWKDGGEDRDLLKDIYRKLPKIDVLIMDSWIHDFKEHLADFSPKMLISQHEDEIGAHGIDHREANWMTLYKNDKIYKIDVPYVLMAWGEWYDYK